MVKANVSIILHIVLDVDLCTRCAALCCSLWVWCRYILPISFNYPADTGAFVAIMRWGLSRLSHRGENMGMNG